MVIATKSWIRESVTQGEGISTPHVCRTRRDPRLLCLLDELVYLSTYQGWLKQKRKMTRQSVALYAYVFSSENEKSEST